MSRVKKRRVSPVGVAFAALVLLVAIFLVRGSLRRPARVVLPGESGTSDAADPSGGTDANVIRRIEVAPATVQRAIATLARPENYSRTVTIERYYEGGSGVSVTTVEYADGWTRINAAVEGEETRHVILGGGESVVWYGSDETYYSGAAAISADEEQSIPTYEDVLALEPRRIVAADYRLLDRESCIYVETAPDALGYTERWWVSDGSGLLVAAEKLLGDVTVYRMSASGTETGGVTAQAFTLPDGTVLHDPAQTS